MAIKTIRQYPDPVLRTPAETVPKITKDIKKLASDMFDTMKAAQGVGLAAPQIGVSKRLIVVDVSEQHQGAAGPLALVNPTIVLEEGSVDSEEGCLSFPTGLRAEIRRYAKVKIKGLNLNGRPVHISAEGLLSRALQHEVDHLDGVLFIDRLSFSQKLKMKQILQALEGKRRAAR